MKLFGRGDDRPAAMDWGSSFAEAEVAAKRRRRGRTARDAYDAWSMTSDHGHEDRPIGSRRADTALPHGFGSAPEPKRRRGIGRRLVSALLLLAVVLLVGGLAWLALSYTGVVGGDPVEAGTKVAVKIPQGATSEQIASILGDAGVVRNATVFRARLKLNGDGSQFHAGTYTFKAGSSYDTIVRVLEKGPAAAPTFDLTIPEGQRLEETAAYIDSMRTKAMQAGDKVLPAFTGAEYLKAVRALRPDASLKAPKGTTSMEGLLFPATYELKHAATAEEFVAKQQDAFAQNLAQVDMTRAKQANLTPYDVVTIASLIEREAKLDKERPLVAAVIWNRLKAGEPLGIDASNQYAAYKPGAKEFWVAELLQSQLDEEGPYNLRKVAGLPPTPIAAPGLKSLEAAANPAKVDYRYYVAKTDGSGAHYFTADYDDFLAHAS